jgi:hypothetical protein
MERRNGAVFLVAVTDQNAKHGVATMLHPAAHVDKHVITFMTI